MVRRILRPWVTAVSERFDQLYSDTATASERLDVLGRQLDDSVPVARVLEGVEEIDGIAAVVRKMSEDLAQVASDLRRIDDSLAAVQALGWDHVAVVNRLGQLEDRLNRQAAAKVNSE
jgi:hypothetical protein